MNPGYPASDADVEYWNQQVTARSTQYQLLEQDKYASAFTYGRYRLHKILRQRLSSLPQGSTVVDIGCGTGAQLGLCKGMGLSLVGVEPASALRALATLQNPEIPVLEGSLEALPFPDQHADFAYAIEVLRYIRRSERVAGYREVLRILKPGGEFLFTMASRYAADGFWFYAQAKAALWAIRGSRPVGRTYFVTPRGLKQELESAGFKDVRFYGCVLGPIRVAYKIAPQWAKVVARLLERMEDRVFRYRMAVGFAGHLVVCARRPV